MKTKTIILTVVAILLIATVAMANSSLVLEPIIKPESVFTPSFDRLASFMGYDTDEKFEEFHSTALFMGKYCTTEESFSFIEQMILSGCDPQTTMDIYQFYLTTNEPISIVKQIYDLVYTGEKITNRDIVFENAFNEITNNKCGVLTEEDVIAYLEKGLSVDDIVQANILCRKAVLTIREILDARLEGTNWESIIEIVSGEDITLPETSETPLVSNAMTLSRITNQSLDAVLSSNNEESYFSKTSEAVNQILKEKGYWKGRKSANFEILVENAEAKGIPKEKIDALMDSGYSELELFNAIKSKDCTPSSIDVIVREEAVR